MFSAIADGFSYLFGLLVNLFGYLLDGLYKLLSPLFDFIGAIFYLIYKLGVILVSILKIVYALGKLLVGLLTGLFATITGFGYSGASASLPSAYTDVYSRLGPIFAHLQMDKVAYMIQFAIWLFTGLYAARIIGSMRGGGSSD